MNKRSQKYLKILFSSLLLVCCTSLFAAKKENINNPKESINNPKENTNNPIGCYNEGYAFDLKTLKLAPREFGGSQSLYIIFNKSNQAINLFQMLQEDSSYSMYLNHSIAGRQWSVLATNEPVVKYICSVAEGKSPYGRVVDCQDHLQVCEYTNVKYGLNNQGNFWLVNSNSKNEAVNAIVRYGIIPSI
ncbi:endopeptidase IV [Legionella sp. D16C41]|uniref:endopeptidase IV n=1 Tax=Legionella sp. D16C41 TaxID=3402688 RepID=UPI003AF88D2C